LSAANIDKAPVIAKMYKVFQFYGAIVILFARKLVFNVTTHVYKTTKQVNI